MSAPRARTAERFFREGGFPSAEAERTGIPVGRIGTRPLPANPPATALGDALRQVVRNHRVEMYEFYEFCRPMVPTACRARAAPLHNSTKAACTGGREKSDLPEVAPAPDSSDAPSQASPHPGPCSPREQSGQTSLIKTSPARLAAYHCKSTKARIICKYDSPLDSR
jgi:hypothetical protein